MRILQHSQNKLTGKYKFKDPMKTSLKILIPVIIIFFFSADNFSQSTDSLKKGSFYSFTLNNGSVLEGKILSVDSQYVYVMTVNGMNEIKKEYIHNLKQLGQTFAEEYFSTYKKPQYKYFLSIDIGLAFPKFSQEKSYYGYYYFGVNNTVNTGLNISADYTAFFSRSMAVRSGIALSYMKNKDETRSDYYNTFSTTGGSMTQFTILGLDLLGGTFHPEDKINLYFLADAGIGNVNSSSVIQESYYISYYDPTYLDHNTYTINPEAQWFFKYGFGAGITYSLNENINLKAEVNYDLYKLESGYYGDFDKLIFKTGIAFINF